MRKVADSEQFNGWAFVTPGAAIIVLFGAVPIVWSAVMSFQSDNLLSPSTPFVGVANYRQLVHDPIVAQAIQNTLIYTALFVPGTMVVGLFLAVAMNRKIRFISVYRTVAYATMAISTISEAIVFIWLFDPSYGIANYLLSQVGLPQQEFLNSPSEALYVIVAMTIWGWTGFAVVVYLSALQGIPQTLVEAASIDGAGRWRRFRAVTLPLLSPASLFLAVWLTINALQLFDEVYLSTQGGPLERDHRSGLLPLQPGLPAVQLRLRVRHRLLPVPHHHRGHGHPVLGGPAVHVLPLMTATSAPAHGGRQVGGQPKARRSGVPVARRRRRLPFSPWHLVLVPATVVLAFPFVWMLLTSVETRQEALRFPPVLLPHVLRFANYSDALDSAPFTRFFVNSAIIAVATVRATSCCARWPGTRSPGSASWAGPPCSR